MWAVRIPLSLVASRWILAGSLALLLYPAAPTLAGDRAGAFPDFSGRIVQEAGRAASIGVVTQLPGRYTGDEVLVRFKDGVAPSERAAGHAQARGTVVKRFSAVRDLELVRLPPGASVRKTIETYHRNSHVEYAEPNYIVSALASPNDPSFSSLWGLLNTGQSGGTPGADIDATRAWDLTTGSNSVVVGVIDTGVDYTHPDLASNIWSNTADCNTNGVDDDGNGYVDDCHGIDTINNRSDPMDDNNHGTHVAGTIGAVGNNAVGVVGVNWNVSIMACKFLNASGQGTVAGAIGCLNYVAIMKDRGVNVVATNNSWGGGDFSRALFDTIDAHRQRGILFIAAAGNDGLSNDVLLTFPATYDLPNVISVAATTRYDFIASFSNWGRRTVHLGAPGLDIPSTTIGNTYNTFSGTSMATPHVTGVAALLKAHNPALDWRAIKNLILAGGDPNNTGAFPSLTYTVAQRRLNAYGSLTCANSTVRARLEPTTDSMLVAVGTRILLSALHINCANPNGEVNVVVNPGNQIVTLRDDGLTPDQASGDGIYSAYWTPSAGGAYTLAFPDGDVVTITVDPDLVPGFPVKALYTAGRYCGLLPALVGNIDDQPDLEIVVTGVANGPLYAFKADGSLPPGWPVSDIFGPSSTAIGNLSNTFAGDEVFSGYFGAPDFGIPGQLAAYSGSGLLLAGWPRDSANFVCPPPALADVDGDGIDEIFVGEEDGAIHAYRADGSTLPGWPLYSPLGGQELSTPAIADLDGDGKPEIITASGPHSDVGNYLFAYHHDGTPVSGFPVLFDGWGDPYPVVGDVDGDGIPEIVVPARLGGVGGGPGVLIISPGGTVKRTIAAAGTLFATPAIALADLDGDCIPEIILQTNGALNVWRGDGSTFPGWPVSVPGTMLFTAPVVGDVDGDGLPDIVVVTSTGQNSTGQVWVFNRFGVRHPHFPKTVNIGHGGVPAIADLNQDGRNKIIITGDFWNGIPGYYDKVWVYDLGGPPSGPIHWGQFMGGPKHQGAYVCPIGPSRPTPTLSGISPSKVTVGGPAFVLTATGTNFVASSLVQVNGSARTTTYVSATQLTATVLESDIAATGMLTITVFTPGADGGTSMAKGLSVLNPVPSLTAISPSRATSGGGAFTLKVTGSNFVPSSVVRLGANRVTTFVSSTELRAGILAADIATAAIMSVTVFTPTPGGGVSNAQTFTVGNPVPLLGSLAPVSVTAGALGFTLTVAGNDFLASSVVQWNGATRPTTFVNSTTIRAIIPATDVAHVGIFQITVLTPSPGGGVSGALSFAVRNPLTSGFTDPTIVAGTTTTPGTVIKVVHITELRGAVDSLRTRTGLPLFEWTDATVVPGSTPARRIHVMDLRTALVEVYQALGRGAPSFTDATISVGVTVIRADHINQLRSAAQALN